MTTQVVDSFLLSLPGLLQVLLYMESKNSNPLIDANSKIGVMETFFQCTISYLPRALMRICPKIMVKIIIDINVISAMLWYHQNNNNSLIPFGEVTYMGHTFTYKTQLKTKFSGILFTMISL